KPGGEPRQRVRRHRLRRQPAVAAVGLPVRRSAGTRPGSALRGDPRRAAEGLSRRGHREGSDGEVMQARPASAADAPAIARIYNEGIEDRVATFETRLRAAADVAAWLDGVHPVVVEHDRDVI